MGKNTVAQVPHDIASHIKLAEPAKYTFHSFRRTAATTAADGGSSSEQMTEFFGWRNSSMCQEYISTSKPAVVNMAKKLAGDTSNFTLEYPEVEIEVEVAEESLVAPPAEGRPSDDACDAASDAAADAAGDVAADAAAAAAAMEWQEDPDLYAVAGLPCPAITVQAAGDVESSLKNALASFPNVHTVKLVVVQGGTNTFQM
jgi:hypothetical protein